MTVTTGQLVFIVLSVWVSGFAIGATVAIYRLMKVQHDELIRKLKSKIEEIDSKEEQINN